MKRKARSKFTPVLPWAYRTGFCFVCIAVVMIVGPWGTLFFSLDSWEEAKLFLQLTNFSFFCRMMITFSGMVLLFPAIWLGDLGRNPEEVCRLDQTTQVKKWASLITATVVGGISPSFLAGKDAIKPAGEELVISNFTGNLWIFFTTLGVSIALLLLRKYQNTCYKKWASARG
jgi:hypothetical protein